MQSVKVVVRQIGISNKGLDIFSPAEVTQDLEYNYGSQGYILETSHYLGEVKDAGGNAQGWKVMFIFTKNEEVALAEERKAKVKA